MSEALVERLYCPCIPGEGRNEQGAQVFTSCIADSLFALRRCVQVSPDRTTSQSMTEPSQRSRSSVQAGDSLLKP